MDVTPASVELVEIRELTAGTATTAPTTYTAIHDCGKNRKHDIGR